jgi:hypothetical protein
MRYFGVKIDGKLFVRTAKGNFVELILLCS